MICIWSSWCHCHPIISAFIKIQIDLSFLLLVYPGCPGKEAIKRTSLCLYCRTNVTNLITLPAEIIIIVRYANTSPTHWSLMFLNKLQTYSQVQDSMISHVWHNTRNLHFSSLKFTVHIQVGWLALWDLTVLLTQIRSYRTSKVTNYFEKYFNEDKF